MQAIAVLSVLATLLIIITIFVCYIFSHSKKEFKIFLGLNLNANALQEVFYGFLLGGGLIMSIFLLLIISSSVSDINTDSTISFFLKEITSTFSYSLLEELFFRSIMLGGIYFLFGQKWLALIISSILFGFVHAANPDATIISVTSNFLGGIMYGLAFLGTRQVWLPIGLHFAWNFFQGPVLGLNVSGFNSKGLLEVELEGSKLLTGGEYGLEASLIGIGFRLICITILIIWFKKNLFQKTN